MPEDGWVPAWVSVQVISTTSKVGVPEDGQVQACQTTLGIVDRDLVHCLAEDMGKARDNSLKELAIVGSRTCMAENRGKTSGFVRVVIW